MLCITKAARVLGLQPIRKVVNWVPAFDAFIGPFDALTVGVMAPMMVGRRP